MLPKKNRVNKDEIEKIFKFGRSIYLSNSSFKFILTKENFSPKISFISPKTIIKDSVSRNSLRRLGYNTLRPHMGRFPLGLLGIFVFNKKINTKVDIENNINFVLNKI